MPEGALEKMMVRPGSPAVYQLVLRSLAGGFGPVLDLNPLIGRVLRIDFGGEITCDQCGTLTRKSYGGGFCYACFRRLAQCDLCVLEPVRCHFAQGTCREPAWGEAFCMQPHLVYLANASGAKVGITRRGHQVTRWLDQGAVQGLVIAAAPSRHLAGVLEAALARHVSDRTHWRALVQGDAPALDLGELRQRLRQVVELPAGVVWVDEPAHAFGYPVTGYPARPVRLRLVPGEPVAGRLVGIKGQYLLFEHGVFNVRQHRSYRVAVTLPPAGAEDAHAPPAAGRDQLDLFG